jgi:uncharacterized protein (DUF885 family)
VYRTAVLALSLLTLACATATTSSPSQSLARLAEQQWQHQLEQDIGTRAELGLPIEHLPDVSLARAEKEAAFARTMLAELARIDAGALTEDERITLGILRHRSRLTADGLTHFYLQSIVTPYASPIYRVVNSVLTRTTFESREDLDRYLRLLGQYGDFIGAIERIVREQQRRGILLPKAEIAIVRATLQNARRDGPASPFFVADERLPRFRSNRNSEFHDALSQIIATQINPALTRLIEVFDAQYEASAPDAVGLAQYPGGADAYRYLIRYHTTLELDPREIHNLGLREVERINMEMARVRETLGFQGTKADFHRFLKTDPRFFAKTPEEIGERLTAYVRKIEPHIPRLFAATPLAPYDVQRLDPALEGAMTFGYYDPPSVSDPSGHYFYNASKLNERSLLSAASLMLHELVPGHHFQIARQIENERIPLFRRKSYDTVFVEGWGEYAAHLGWELGVFDDPYDKYGRLMLDMMIAVRLVVDTGMNALGWSRAQAMDFMREHTLLSDTELATETLRYSVDIPGQALAYKIGSLRMIELRRRAEQQLGATFDVRQFHEWMIGSGSMPISVLEEHVERVIK